MYTTLEMFQNIFKRKKICSILDYHYGYPTRHSILVISECTGPRIEAVLTHALDYQRASNCGGFLDIRDEYNTMPGIDIIIV